MPEHGGNLLVRGGRVVGREGVDALDVRIENGTVVELGPALAVPGGSDVLDARGRLVLPGLIDPQVHFREPGYPHKEDLASGSLAAIAGGVTTFLEMPNTDPPTTDPARLADKVGRAAGRAHADHAFFLGATPENADRLGAWETLPACAGVKVFMGSSTGSLLVADDRDLERVLRSGHRRVAVHAEDETRLRTRIAAVRPGTSPAQHPDVRDVECALRATRRLVDLAEATGRPVHVLHVSTAEEIELLRERALGDLVTAEVTPHHLFLEAPDCYARHGTRVQMNPPVRDRRHRDALREALADGTVACIGSDHAPHTLAEKSRPYPQSPSGIPGAQTTLALLLTAVRDGWLRLPDIVRACVEGPARVFSIARKGALRPGIDGDLVLVDPSVDVELPASWLRSRAGYSPYEGLRLAGWPVVTVLRGRVAYRSHEPVGAPAGRPVEFR